MRRMLAVMTVLLVSASALPFILPGTASVKLLNVATPL